MANSTLFVGGIVPTASVEKIEDEFKKFGECSCSFPSKGKGNYGFIAFEDRKEAKTAMLHINGMKFSGERLGVDWQKQKRGTTDVWTPERRKAAAARSSDDRDRRTRDTRARERVKRDDNARSTRDPHSIPPRNRHIDEDSSDVRGRMDRSRSMDRNRRDCGPRCFNGGVSRGDGQSNPGRGEARGRSERAMNARWSRSHDRPRGARPALFPPERAYDHRREADRSRDRSSSKRQRRSRSGSVKARRAHDHERARVRVDRPEKGSHFAESRPTVRPEVERERPERRSSRSEKPRESAFRGNKKHRDRNTSLRHSIDQEGGRGSIRDVLRSAMNDAGRSGDRVFPGEAKSCRRRDSIQDGGSWKVRQGSRGVRDTQETAGGLGESGVIRDGSRGPQRSGSFGGGISPGRRNRRDSRSVARTHSSSGDGRGRHRRAEPLEDAFGVSVEDAHANEMPESAQVEKMREPELSVALIEGMSLSELRESLRSRKLNFSGKRPALTKRLTIAVGW